MFKSTSLQDWEKLVKEQLKTDDIYSVLSKENLEGIVVKPYYDSNTTAWQNLPKNAESAHLVAAYHESLEENTLAFLLNQNVEGLTHKVLFINNTELAEHISLQEENTYFSLIDVFSDDGQGILNDQLAKELLAKNFQRNIAIDISLHQNGGGSMVQQLAFALLKTKDIIEVFGREIIHKLLFRIAIGSNYFFEIAKIRALKLVVNQLTKEFGLDEVPFIFAETTLRNKARHDPENNIIRSTFELSAAMIGGADAVFSNDYKVENGDELSQEISYKQNIVLAYESLLNVFEDAAHGSYYIENITTQLAEKSWQLFLELEEKGGYCAMLKQNIIQQMIYDHAIKEQSWVEEGKIKLIGVNLYPQRIPTRSVQELYDPAVIKPVRWAEMFE